MDKLLIDARAYYGAEQNKRLVYHIVLGLWILTLTLCHLLLSLFPLSEGRASAYVILFFTMPLLYGVTHWLFVCLLSVPLSELSLCGHKSGTQNPAIYSVGDDHDVRISGM